MQFLSWPGPGTRVGQIIEIGEVRTDNNRLITWTAAAADIANQAVDRLGVERIGITKPKIEGYQAVPLDGIWLRAPYLHNGSVPNLTELLEPEEKRSKVFYRGYDLYDPVLVGFDSQSAEAQRLGNKFDTAVKGNGNLGHLYGTTLPPEDKKSLIEYLKTMGPSRGTRERMHAWRSRSMRWICRGVCCWRRRRAERGGRNRLQGQPMRGPEAQLQRSGRAARSGSTPRPATRASMPTSCRSAFRCCSTGIASSIPNSGPTASAPGASLTIPIAAPQAARDARRRASRRPSAWTTARATTSCCNLSARPVIAILAAISKMRRPTPPTRIRASANRPARSSSAPRPAPWESASSRTRGSIWRNGAR